MRSGLQWAFLVVSVGMIGLFLYFSNVLVRSLGDEERAKMEIWADAYRQLFLADQDADLTLELKVIHGNTTIPVFYTEADGTLLGSNNIEIPRDTATFIRQKIAELQEKGNYFEIEIGEDWSQFLYYDESILLQQLHYYPYIQLMVIIVVIFLFYYMLMSRKRAEQNRVWVGLSKETAHQLGTPISSMMAWMDVLRTTEGVDPSIIEEMDKDVYRLHTVADRFSKIGSMPKMEPSDLCEIIRSVASYMQKRASSHISIEVDCPSQPFVYALSSPLFAWVVENLCRNAIDAMKDGRGQIRIRLFEEHSMAVIEVEDNGKGIPKNLQKDIFRAGYTTKKRGWGLGLTLVKRIVEEYHRGHIFVKSSAVGIGTIFRIELKK